MSDLPPLSLGTSPWSTAHRYVPVGGGRKPSREDSLLSSLDDISSLDSDDENRGKKRLQALYSSLVGRLRSLCSLLRFWERKKEEKSRVVVAGEPRDKYPHNAVQNNKYNFITFVPKVLFHQFKVFLNLYFLVIALTQLVPPLRIGYWYTYWGPLLFVLTVTMLRELYDDIKRVIRDRSVNKEQYTKITTAGRVSICSSDITVSDVIIVHKDQRVPADMILLRTSDPKGSCFLRTDQLDGETDWKLRLATPKVQQLSEDEDVLHMDVAVTAEKPQQEIHSFNGRLSMEGDNDDDSLSIDNTLWANTVVASGHVVGLVIYTGKDTRSVRNTSQPRAKSGLVDNEINTLTKVLFSGMFVFALIMLALKGFHGPWYLYLLRYVILFSYIIPISLRVNLDMAKLVYSWIIQHDKLIPNTIVRSSTIPEELGRIEYLLTDKTGTLTQNEMLFKKIHLGTTSYSVESFKEIQVALRTALSSRQKVSFTSKDTPAVAQCVLALAMCHNVTPVVDEPSSEEEPGDEDEDDEEMILFGRTPTSGQTISYQASSPDEIALVKWTESVGITLIARDSNSLQLRLPNDQVVTFKVLQLFPFTSERKRMGIIVKNTDTNEIVFLIKGADTVLGKMVQYNDWLDEECGNLAREGLRTMVVAKKVLTEEEYMTFESQYRQAQLSVTDRASQTAAVIDGIEENLDLLCITGVEDQLQVDVRPTLELLKNAGIKVWMLTGDKLETAASIAVSSRLISRSQTLHIFQEVTSRVEVHSELNNFRKKSECALVITGSSLKLCIQHYENEFIELASQCPAVVCCRCSPTHKADVVHLIKTHCKKLVCAIGDGGNDVRMIQAANVGIGIVGKEGKQASLAADFSITQFKHVSRLLVWHGRNSYKRSAALSQFVIHRGLIISAMQAVFSALFYFAAVMLYEGFLMIGYATIYTMAPVFSLILDEDVSADIALTYPELYKELMKGRTLSFKTFFLWILVSIYQGGIIMLLGFILFHSQFIYVVSITFTSLILTELLMVALTIRTWHLLMLAAEVFSIIMYVVSLWVFKDYFDINFLLTFEFAWKTLVLTIVSCVPLIVLKITYRYCAPPSYAKLLKKNSMFRNCCKLTC